MSLSSIQVVKPFLEAITRRDLAALRAASTEDLLWRINYYSSPPAEHRGFEAVQQMLVQMFAPVEVVDMQVRQMTEQGNLVTIVGWERLREKATGQELENPWIAVGSVRDGKVAEVHMFYAGTGSTGLPIAHP